MSNARDSVKDIEPIIEFPSVYEDEGEAHYEEPEIETVSVMLMQVAIVKVIGDVTGREYVFNGGGSIVEMDKRDIGIINKYNIATATCCGGLSSPYFKFI